MNAFKGKYPQETPQGDSTADSPSDDKYIVQEGTGGSLGRVESSADIAGHRESQVEDIWVPGWIRAASPPPGWSEDEEITLREIWKKERERK